MVFTSETRNAVGLPRWVGHRAAMRSSSRSAAGFAGRRQWLWIVAWLALGSCGLAAPALFRRESGAANVVRLTMRTPHAGFNRMVVQVTVCLPGSRDCATIDDVMVDTGSTGLRLEASALPPRLRFPPVLGPDRQPLAECLRFVADDAWGPLERVDLQLGGLRAPGLPVQVIDDGARSRPMSCPRSTVRPTSNGTLGIGSHLTDCPGECRPSAGAPLYFRCRDDRCEPLDRSLAETFRLPNPVAFLEGHDNGVVFDMPEVAGAGAREAVGTLTFGVGTGDFDRLGPAAILRLDDRGRFTTLYAGRSDPDSYIDSGTETDIVADDAMPRCPGMSWAFCVAPEETRQAVVVGRDGARSVWAFRVGDYREIRQRGFGASAAATVAAPARTGAFVWGAPFFLGRPVVLVMEDRAVPGIVGLRGPLYAVPAGPRSKP